MRRGFIRRRERQQDLFLPDLKARSSLGIPADAKRKITPLLARMLREYRLHLLANESGKEVAGE